MEREYFDKPSPEVQEQMKAEGFKIGLPKKAKWYLVAVRSNDREEYYNVFQAWFNPDSPNDWYIGGGYVSNKSEPFQQKDRIRAYREMPKFGRE